MLPVLATPNGFVGAALTNLGVARKPTELERAYNEGRSTQVPVNAVVRVKGRFARRLGYRGNTLKLDRWTLICDSGAFRSTLPMSRSFDPPMTLTMPSAICYTLCDFGHLTPGVPECEIRGRLIDRAVLDGRLRVRGVQALRVIDCSIFPQQLSGNTNGPVMAAAWRASELILEDHPR